MKTIYFAAPLFTLAEREFNNKLASSIEKKLGSRLKIILPQTFATKYAKDKHFFNNLFKECIRGVEESDIVLAVLDGPDSDSGTCVEIGYALAKGKPVIGIRTDIRISEDRGLNLMVSQLCASLVFDLENDMDSLTQKVIDELKKLL